MPHDGGAPDHDAGLKRYQGLQDRLREALVDPATPDEAHLPLANAGYRLYTGANAAGLAEAKSIPYSAREAITGSVPFSGGGSVGPRVTSMPRGREVLPATVGNRTAVAVEGEVPGVAVKAPQVVGLEEAAPVTGAGVVGLESPAVATARASPPRAATESAAQGLSPPAALEGASRGGEGTAGLAGPKEATMDAGPDVPAGGVIRRSRGVTNPEIGRIPKPPVPAGMTRAQFGDELIKWGKGPETALQRMDSLMPGELVDMRRGGLTRQMAEQWRDFYTHHFNRNSNNTTAQNRVKLMQKILDNWQEQLDER